MFITGAFGLAQKLGSAPPGISGVSWLDVGGFFVF